MKKCSIRSLARQCVGAENLGRKVVDRTLAVLAAAGWQPNYRPMAEDYDRPLVLVRVQHPLAPLLDLTFKNEVAAIERAVIERHAEGNLADWEIGQYLGRHGIAILHIDDAVVRLRGTNADLAVLINRTRYHCQVRVASTRAVAAALGLADEPRVLKEVTRLAAAVVYERFGADASSLLDGDPWAILRSSWSVGESAGARRGGHAHV